MASYCPSLVELRIRDCFQFESLTDEEAAYGDRQLHQRDSLHYMQDYPCGNETQRAFVVVTAKISGHLRDQKLLTFFLSLKFLEIRSTAMKKGIFEVEVRGTVENEESIQIQESLKLNSELCELALYDIPKLEYIWKGPTQIVSLHKLEEVTLEKCPRLKNNFTPVIVTNLPELRRLKVEECEEWEGILCEESLKNLSSNVCFPKLEKIEITKCNKVKWLFLSSLASHCPSLKQLDIKECSELERLVYEEAAHRDRPAFLKLERLYLYKLPKLREIFGGELEYSQHKHENERARAVNSEVYSIYIMYLGELEYIWRGPSQSVSLHRLASVKLSCCPKLKNAFTLVLVTSFPELRTLEVHHCKEWEGIFCEESLKNLSSSNVCFPKLKDIGIWGFNKMKWLFSYSLVSHCPSLEKIIITTCYEIEGVVKGREGEVGDHEKLFPRLKRLSLIDLPKLGEIYPGYEFKPGSDRIEHCPNVHFT